MATPQDQINSLTREQTALDKRLAVLEAEMRTELRQLREAQTSLATNVGRLVWLFAAGMIAGIVNFIVSGGLNVGQ